MQNIITLQELSKLSKDEVLELHAAAQIMFGTSKKVRDILNREPVKTKRAKKIQKKTPDSMPAGRWTGSRKKTEAVRKSMGIPRRLKDRTDEQQQRLDIALRESESEETKGLLTN